MRNSIAAALIGASGTRSILAGCIMMLSINVAAQDAPRVSLQPSERKQIQAVGANLLRAMRTAGEEAEVDALRTQLGAMRQHILSLTQIDSNSSLSIQGKTGHSPLAKSSAVKPNHEHTLNALRSQINHFRRSAEALREEQEERSSQDLWDRVVSFFSASDAAPATANYVVTPLTRASVMSLDHLEDTVMAAMALPAKERHSQLEAIVDTFVRKSLFVLYRAHIYRACLVIMN